MSFALFDATNNGNQIITAVFKMYATNYVAAVFPRINFFPWEPLENCSIFVLTDRDDRKVDFAFIVLSYEMSSLSTKERDVDGVKYDMENEFPA